ncbi:MAG: multidrug ABC transporter ATP-binding protein, partial [Rhodospirillales bacterium 20-60-12]
MRDVLGFVFAHWRRHGAITVLIAVSMSLATFADVFLPLFAGDVVNDIAAATPATMNHQAYMAVQALVIMAALGCAQISLRFLGMRGILQLTVRTMSDVAQDAFARLQRFSADWHANTFAGSVVRKVTRGMWALDLLNDTILLALLPAIVVLAGSAIMLGLQWPTLGAMVAIGACLFGVLTVLMTVKYVAPAAQLSNAWDTKVGGALADAIGCNAVVKAFGAEEREEKKL